MNNKVILAQNAGFCFGVKRAVEEALEKQKEFNKRVYTLGPLIHNNDAVEFLKSNEIYPIEISEVEKLGSDDVIIIRSHGISKKLYDKIQSKGINIIDATCPYVKNIQMKVYKYYEQKYSIVIVGDPNHPEVIGINGWCNDSAIICKNGEVNEPLPKRICVVSQTTEKQSNWKKVLEKIVESCKEFVAFNTICSATEERQKSAEELSKKVDAMIVIGGKESSNTTKLYEICKENCLNTVHVERASEIPDYIVYSDKHLNIGVTAGASTPDWIIKEALLKMNEEKVMEMNEQLAYMNENDKKIHVGQLVKGEIISVNEKGLYVNIGYKADAVIPKEEALRDQELDLNDLFKVGQEIEAKVLSRMNEDGYVVLSRIEIEREEGFKELKSFFENGELFNVEIKEAVKGGVIANYKGVKVFIPASHIELFHIEDLKLYEGKTIEVKVIEFKEERNQTKIVVSRRAILEEEKRKQEEKAWESFEVGKIYEGEVKRITGFGAFVAIDGVDGLLHISEISWGKIDKTSDVLKQGDKVKVVILELDKENRKLSLSMKALTPDPWKDVDEKYPAGNIVLGKVVRFTDFGAFIELEPGVDGLVHISEISHKRINKPSDMLKIGEQIKAKILDVNPQEKRISLSIKAVE